MRTEASDVCFVALKCAGQLMREPVPRYIGGIERQLVNLGRALAAHGMNVSFVTYADTGLDRPTATPEGIVLHPAFVRDAGVRVLRFVHPRATGILRAMRHANAAVYVAMGGGAEAGIAAAGAELALRQRRPFLMMTASDRDCSPLEMREWPAVDRMLYRYALRRAARIVVQSNRQQQLLAEHFGYSSALLPLPYSSEFPPRSSAPLQSRSAIWVGRVVEDKRPDWLIHIAQRLPDWTFYMVGSANADTEYARRFEREAATVKNLVRLGKVSDKDLHEHYANAAVLLCTSRLEGFPTTFIEASYHGMPIVSTFDPDDVIQRNSLGAVCRSVEDVCEALTTALPARGGEWSINTRAYFERDLSTAACIPPIAALLAELSGKRAASRSAPGALPE